MLLFSWEHNVHNNDIGAYVQRGRQALVERRFDDARAIYQQILQLDPAQPRAWLALSALAQSQGDFRESVRAVRAAVPAWKGSGSRQFITELSRRLLVLGEYEEARDIIVSADWSDPTILRYSMGLVQYLGLVEAHQEALELAEHALARVGNAPASLKLSRANALRYLGRMKEAEEAYEACIALDPLYAEAHWSLAQHGKSVNPGARIQRLRKAIAHTAGNSEDAIYLQYALFKELDDTGEVADAWGAVTEGARMKRATINYDLAHHEASFRALLRLSSPEFLKGKASQESGVEDFHIPIFIVGLPRSGTTLLERILGNHPEVGSAGELNDFPLQLSWETGRFLGEYLGSKSLDACAGIDFQSLGRGYLDRTRWRTNGKRYLIDKLPNNVMHAGFIHMALPGARIICMQRDKMDSCFSTFKHLFSGNSYAFSYDLDEMYAQYERFDRLTKHWTSVLGDRFLMVNYEQLAKDPANTVQRVAEFCGLSYQPEMLDLQRNTSPSATASSSQVRRPIHDQSIGGWKRYSAMLMGQQISG